MSFESTLESWIVGALTGHDLAQVQGFAFNLMEPGNGGFGIELIGAPAFSEDDPDWPCDEIFEASPRSIPIPDDTHGGDWQSCLASTKSALKSIIDSGSEAAGLLRQAKGIGVGFVDGDLETLYVAS